jgi:arylsulfatase A-like enzyme
MNRPNFLFFILDGMQAETIDAAHPCQTPNIERLKRRGVTFQRAHTCCPVCSPARASLMTGLLPHNHGVLEVEHGKDDDQCVLREEKPHFAQRLIEAGYRTGYFGKWHIERSNELERFGWQTHVVKGSEHHQSLGQGTHSFGADTLDPELCGWLDEPPGYKRILHFGVTDTPPEERPLGVSMRCAREFLRERSGTEDPWACAVSFSEPNEALVCGRPAFEQYDPDAIELPANLNADFSGRPNLYRRERLITRNLSESHWRRARACYYGCISEMDAQFGTLLDQLEAAGTLDDTVVILMADHGRYVGAHGFDAHNIGAFEEIYRIPLVMSGPGIEVGTTNDALVGIQDICPTVLELAGAREIGWPDSKSFAAELSKRDIESADSRRGYAEYHGSRFPLAQRILWEDNWKFVFNGFDFDELYDLRNDPREMRNMAVDPAQADRMKSMMSEIWNWLRVTGDRTLLETHYFSLRLGVVGPNFPESGS